jgi:hypothetical protein
LLELYGDAVLFDDPLRIEGFLSGSELHDKSFWRKALLAVRDLKPVATQNVIH